MLLISTKDHCCNVTLVLLGYFHINIKAVRKQAEKVLGNTSWSLHLLLYLFVLS